METPIACSLRSGQNEGGAISGVVIVRGGGKRHRARCGLRLAASEFSVELVNLEYAGSKAGIIGFVKALARELAQEGITVNAICPGVTGTAQPRGHRSEKELLSQAKSIPLGRIGQPDVWPDLFSFSPVMQQLT